MGKMKNLPIKRHKGKNFIRFTYHLSPTFLHNFIFSRFLTSFCQVKVAYLRGKKYLCGLIKGKNI